MIARCCRTINSLTPALGRLTTVVVIKRLLQLALLLGAVVGLLGQSAALARLPTPTTDTHAMSDDCMQQMAQPKVAKPEKPCHGLTLDCISAMGCIVNVTLAEAIVLPLALSSIVLAPTDPRSPHLSGRAVAPNLEPPSLS